MLRQLSFKTVIVQCAALVFIMFAACVPAYAEETVAEVKVPIAEEAGPETLPIINTTIIAEIDSSIIVKLDGETLESTEVRRAENGGLYVNAMPIFQTLGNQVEFDADTKALIVRRSQDNVIMELYTDTGIVKANGRPLGKLAHFGEVSDRGWFLTSNAIAVLTGTSGTFDKDEHIFEFKLDPRLRIATGFDIFVEGVSLGRVEPAPKSVGSVLLLPIRPIAEALGHDFTLSDSGQTVNIRRAQDSARLSLDLSTGLVKSNNVPVGVSKDVTFIDRTNLLLPVSAVEALTGTHVKVEGGSSRVEITLDDRLTNSIEPGERVTDLEAEIPFTVESLAFNASPSSGVQADLDWHTGTLNGRVRLETGGLPSNVTELQPSWLSVDFAHTSDLTGSVGDYSANNRELDSVGERRVRGLAMQKVDETGRWSIVAGVPSTGVRRISKDQTRQTFDGAVFGARLAARDGWEAGLALKQDGPTGDKRAVLDAISGSIGRDPEKATQWDLRGAVGLFDGAARENAVDMRAFASLRHELNDEVDVSVTTQYEGAEFLRSKLDAEDRADRIADVIDPDRPTDSTVETIDESLRERGLDAAAIGASLRYAPAGDTGVFNNPAIGLSLTQDRNGFFKNSDEASRYSAATLNGATGLGETGINLSSTLRKYSVAYKDDREDVTGTLFSTQLVKSWDEYAIRAQYETETASDRENRQSASVTVSRTSWQIGLPKEAVVSLSPSISGVWTGDDFRTRGGITASLNSGQTLGRKTKLTASLGVLQSLNSRGDDRTDKFLSVGLARRVRLGENMALGLEYRNNLRGNDSVGLQLSGRFDFNEKRRIARTKEGRGVLTGEAFLDHNRDGIRQEDEPPMPRVLVKAKGTGLGLRTDSLGNFTIQNIKEGLYEMQIDARSLPMGYDLSADAMTRVTIRDGRITELTLPIHQRGQIRGFAFIDANESGEYEKGEERLEGVALKLDTEDGSVEKTVYTSSFGQYAFDDLAAGAYKVSVKKSSRLGLPAQSGYIIDLTESPDLMGRRNIALRREEGPTIPSDSAEAPIEPKAPDVDMAIDTLVITSVPPPDALASGAAPP